MRGAHRCPMYDSSYGNCSQYPSFSAPGPANGNTSTISYIYPDGLGWPYANNFSDNNNIVLSVLETFASQEEIHNADMIMLGTLWDMYAQLKVNHGGDDALSRQLMTQLVLESVRHLPLPNSTSNHSPITYVGYASNLATFSDQLSGFTESDRSSIRQVLRERGLYQNRTLDSSTWMGVGSGTNNRIPQTSTPGVFILDDPSILKAWLRQMSLDSKVVNDRSNSDHLRTLESHIEPGEVATIWFDIQNNSDLTAGGVLVTVTSSDPDVLLLDDSMNNGFMTSSGQDQVQVMYQKINGTAIVQGLSSSNSETDSAAKVPIGNSYFRTNPFFYRSWTTAIWIKASPLAAHGKIVHLTVQATPSNGVSATQDFSFMIN